MIQIRNVPDDMHRELKHRAAAVGMTLSDYIKDRLAGFLAMPTPQEWVRRLPDLDLDVTSDEIVEMIRRDRESH